METRRHRAAELQGILNETVLSAAVRPAQLFHPQMDTDRVVQVRAQRLACAALTGRRALMATMEAERELPPI